MAHDGGGGGDEHGFGGEGSLGTGDDDVVRVLIDPFLDKRTAYFFSVNPRGARSEGLTAGGSASLNWDGIWDAKGRIDAGGWSAELKIPFKTISFKPELTAWGINVERFIARKQETIRLAGGEPRQQFLQPHGRRRARPGSPNVKQGKGITIRPYGLVSVQQDHRDGAGSQWKLDGGFDVYKNFTPNLVGAFSYNMDFAETEADERRINLTRFPLFFPEKRMFFLEGSETFSFSSSVSFQPFFSRKIGLYQGEQVPILFGGKVYGKIGRTNLAFLDVQTEKFAGLPGRNFLALRVTQDIFSESKVGMIFTNGSPTGERNTLAAVDFRYATSRFAGDKNLNLAAWAAYNWNEKTAGSHAGFGFRANYPNDLWDIQSTYAYYGEALDPGLGFMLRQGIQTAYLRVGFQPRPRGGFLEELRPAVLFQRQRRFLLGPARQPGDQPPRGHAAELPHGERRELQLPGHGQPRRPARGIRGGRGGGPARRRLRLHQLELQFQHRLAPLLGVRRRHRLRAILLGALRGPERRRELQVQGVCQPRAGRQPGARPAARRPLQRERLPAQGRHFPLPRPGLHELHPVRQHLQDAGLERPPEVARLARATRSP